MAMDPFENMAKAKSEERKAPVVVIGTPVLLVH
jgi:hypothetical protein